MLGIQTGTTEASFTNRTQKVEDRISDVKDMKEEMDTEVKDNVKYEKFLTQNHPGNQGYTMKRINLRIIRIEEGEESKFKSP